MRDTEDGIDEKGWERAMSKTPKARITTRAGRKIRHVASTDEQMEAQVAAHAARVAMQDVLDGRAGYHRDASNAPAWRDGYDSVPRDMARVAAGICAAFAALAGRS